MALSWEDMMFLGEVVRERSGLILTPDRGYLVDSRLGPLARREQFDGVEGLVAALRTSADERLKWAVTDALTTNETSFFRDRTPFDQFRDEMLPALAAARPDGVIRIWSAACSTGQEPYSLAILMAEIAHRFPRVTLDICASDISERCLEKARSGVYTQFEVQRGLPIGLLIKYFDKIDDTWRVKPEIRAAVRWRRFNLLDDMLSLGRFDVVLCRHVLIYLDAETQTRVLASLARSTAEDGYLLLGAAEAVRGVSNAFEAAPEGRGLYKRSLPSRAA